MKKVNLFIAGFSKCGTTSLYDLLVASKFVRGGQSKESGYFSAVKGRIDTGSDKDWSMGGTYYKGQEWYDALFPKRDAPYLLEASTIYGFDTESPGLIHDYNKEARIIFIVRDPYDRIESHYYQEKKTGRELPNFHLFVQSDHPRLAFYKDQSRYERVLQNYKHFFNDQILVLHQKQLTQPDDLSVILSEFLGINLSLSESVRSNKRMEPRFPALKKALISFERSRFARQSPRWIQRLGSISFRFVDRLILKKAGKTEVNPLIKNKLRAEFQATADYLQKNYSIKL